MLARSICLIALLFFLVACTAENTSLTQMTTPFPTATKPLTHTPLPPLPTSSPTQEPSPTLTIVPTPTQAPSPTQAITPTPAATTTPAAPYEALMTLVTMAHILYEDGHYEMVAVIYTQLLNHLPDDTKIYLLRADTYDRMGDFAAAISDYQTAIELGATDFALNNLCWDLGITGQADKALPYCEQAVATDPSPASHDSRGVTYAQLGMLQEALADFQVVVEDLEGVADPSLRDIHTQRAEWLVLLKDGVNPITPEVLAQLRHDTSAITATSTPAPDDVAVNRSSVQDSASQEGFIFDEVDTSGDEESLTGNLVKGSCQAVLKLVGPHNDLTAAWLQLSGCSDEAQSGRAYWFITEFLPDDREKAEAIVYMVMEVYYVIEGEITTTGKQEIGNVIFETKRSEAPTPSLEIWAHFNK